MGVSYVAKAVIGVRIRGDRLKTVQDVRGCGHPLGSGRFCQSCGKLSWVPQDTILSAFAHPKWPEEYTDEPGDGEGLGLFFGTDRRWAVYGYGVVGRNDNEPDGVDVERTVTDIQTACEAVLGPLGLWDEKEFGLWAILYCSY